MRKTMTVALFGLFATVPLSAQTDYTAIVVKAMKPTKYLAPSCPLKGGDFRTSSAGVYLKTAAEGGFNDANSQGKSQVDDKKYTDIVIKAQKAAMDAVAANKQNAAGWYFLGRSDMQLGDLRGADTSFANLVTLSPECVEEVKSFRNKAWLALVTPSAEWMRKAQSSKDPAEIRAYNDSALSVLRAANLIAPYFPQGFYNLAGTFTNMKPPVVDSAIFYFKVAQEKAGATAATDAQSAETQKNSTYNMAYLYQMAGDNANAIVQYRKYLDLDPGNADVKRALASTLRLTGDSAEAGKYEGQLMSTGALSPREIMGIGVAAFNAKDYPKALDAFQKVLAIQPHNHDALYDLANTYLAMGDGARLIEISQKLLDADPLGENNVKLLANGYRLLKNQDKQIEVTTTLLAMPIAVTVDSMRVTAEGGKLYGTATGREAVTASGKAIVPTAMTLVFELTNAEDVVVGSQEVPVSPLQPNAKFAIAVDVKGAGISAWKYHVKK